MYKCNYFNTDKLTLFQLQYGTINEFLEYIIFKWKFLVLFFMIRETIYICTDAFIGVFFNENKP